MPRTLLIAASVIVVSSASVFAGMAVEHATLVNPVNKRFMADSVVWHCDGANCVSASELKESAKKNCRALARKVGPLASYEGLDAAQLEKCNAR